MRYSYVARDADSSLVEGFVEALDEQGAVRRLAADGLRVVDLKATEKQGKTGKVRRVGANDLEQPFSELAILLGGGVQVLTAVESVGRTSTSSAISSVFQTIATQLRSGENFAAAFAKAAPAAPPAIKAIIRAGDAAGALGPAVQEAADTLAFQGGLRRDMMGALIYPLVLLIAGIGAAAFMTITVIPRFAETIGDRVNSLPAFTQTVFAVSLWMKANVTLVMLAAGACGAVLGQMITNPAMRALTADAAVSTPILKDFMLAFESARWAGLFSALVSRKAPLLEAMSIAREGFTSGRLQRQMKQAERAVRRGQTIAKSIQTYTSLPPTLVNLIAAGEASGDLAGAARNAAAVFQERARTFGKRATALIEPLTVLIIGGFIGALAVTMLTAITSVTAAPNL